MFFEPKKTAHAPKGNRLLITITVLGSAGPIRFIVNEQDPVASVMDTALKLYAREGRLPVLGSDTNDFMLYCPSAAILEALSPSEAIGSLGFRNFTLCKKPMSECKKKPIPKKPKNSPVLSRNSSWKAWFSKSSKIVSH